MGFHGGGWWLTSLHDEQQTRPIITRALLWRVWQFAKPYRLKIILLLLTILMITGLTLVSPLLVRSLIDDAIPNRDYRLLTLLAVGMVAIPIVNGGIGVLQRSLTRKLAKASFSICAVHCTSTCSKCPCAF